MVAKDTETTMSPPALSSKIKGLRFMQRAAETIKKQQETSAKEEKETIASKDGVKQAKKTDSWAEEASKTTCVILKSAGYHSSTSSYGKMTFGSKKVEPIDVVDEQAQTVEKDLKRMHDDPQKSADTKNAKQKKKRRRQ